MAEEFPTFAECVENLFTLCDKVLKYNLEGELVLTSTKSNGIVSGFRGYRTLFNKSKDSSVHVTKFKEVYDKCKPVLEKSATLDDFVSWFKDKPTFILAPRPDSSNKLYLSVIFRKCLTIAGHLNEEAERYPERADRLLADVGAVFPEHYLLCLLRIFYHCTTSLKEKDMLLDHVTEIENNMGLNSGDVPDVDDPLASMFSSVIEVAKDMGMEIPDNAPQITSSSFKEAIAGFGNNPQMKEALKSTLKGINLKNPGDIGSAFSQIFENMRTTVDTVPEPVQRSLEATADDE